MRVADGDGLPPGAAPSSAVAAPAREGPVGVMLDWLRWCVGARGVTGRRGAALLATAVSLAAYALSLGTPFIWDDVTWIVEDQAVHSLAGVPLFFVGVSTPPPDAEGGNLRELDFYRPLVKTAYALEYALFGSRPAGYHAVNLLLNAAVAVLFLLVVREFSGDPRLALAAALLFAVNPVRGEAVYWVYGLSEILMALAVLGALLLYHRRHTIGAAACFGLGLFAREPAILFPLVLLLYEHFIGSGRRARRFLRVLPFVALALAFLAWRGHVVGGTPALTTVAPLTLANTAAVIVQKSVKIALFPDGPVVHYPLRLFAEATPTVMVSWVVVIALIAAFVVLARRDRQLAFWFAWFFTWLLLSFNVGQLGEYLFAEKWLYLAAGGICVVAAGLLLRLRLGPAVLAVVLLVHFSTVVARSTYWWSPLVYFQQIAASAPDFAPARYMLGMEYAERQDYAKAAGEFAATVRLQPGNSWALNNLGNSYWMLRDRERAVATWERALAGDPVNPRPAYNLGMAAEAADDWEKAVRHYRLFLQRSKEAPPGLFAKVAELERRISAPHR